MIDSELEPVDPALIGSLRADFQLVDSDARERVTARLASSVAALTLNREAPKSSPGPLMRGHTLGLVASFVLGGLCGAGIYGALRAPPHARVVYVERPATSSASPIPEPLVVASAAASAPAAPPLTTPSGVLDSASSARPGFASLAQQQALLDLARAAFARSDYPATLALLKAHFQRFPKSVLGEEREALEIKALAASGRMAEAQARAARFKAQFAQSVLLPSVNDSLTTNP